MKWSFMPKQSDGRPHYLVVNADESEPGTCKDRDIIRHDPHKLVEGCLIAGAAMAAHAGYIYIRGEFYNEASPSRDRRCRRGLRGRPSRQERRADRAGISTSMSIAGRVPTSAARKRPCIESLEGKKGQPRLKPPFPAGIGPLWLPDHGQQRRDHRGGADHPAPWRRVVRRASAGRRIPAPSCSASPAM